MQFKLSNSVVVGNKIMTAKGWEKVIEVNNDGALVKSGLIRFGETVYGWKYK